MSCLLGIFTNLLFPFSYFLCCSQSIIREWTRASLQLDHSCHYGRRISSHRSTSHIPPIKITQPGRHTPTGPITNKNKIQISWDIGPPSYVQDLIQSFTYSMFRYKVWYVTLNLKWVILLLIVNYPHRVYPWISRPSRCWIGGLFNLNFGILARHRMYRT